MKKIIYYTLKVISILLLSIPVILCLPGLIFHVLSEEFYDKFIEENNKNNNNDNE